MKNSLLILGITLLSFLLSSCSSTPQKPLDYEQIADQITAETGKQLKKEKELVLVGTGGRMMNDIQMMAMSFFLYHEISLEESRDLVLYAAEKYLKNINANKEVRPYLHDDPFTIKNIEVWLWLCNSDRSNLSSEKMSFILLADDKITYCSSSQGYLNPLYEETYEEACDVENSSSILKEPY